ncbi:hypothetical protein ACFL46_01910 [Candidatus Neomarinimicrobiota bacterium]
MNSINGTKNRQFSQKFYIGVVFIIASLIVGKITQGLFIWFFDDVLIRQLAIIAYIVSWPFFIAGIWIVGSEYADRYKQWGSFKFYYQKLVGFFRRDNKK